MANREGCGGGELPWDDILLSLSCSFDMSFVDNVDGLDSFALGFVL